MIVVKLTLSSEPRSADCVLHIKIYQKYAPKNQNKIVSVVTRFICASSIFFSHLVANKREKRFNAHFIVFIFMYIIFFVFKPQSQLLRSLLLWFIKFRFFLFNCFCVFCFAFNNNFYYSVLMFSLSQFNGVQPSSFECSRKYYLQISEHIFFVVAFNSNMYLAIVLSGVGGIVDKRNETQIYVKSYE